MQTTITHKVAHTSSRVIIIYEDTQPANNAVRLTIICIGITSSLVQKTTRTWSANIDKRFDRGLRIYWPLVNHRREEPFCPTVTHAPQFSVCVNKKPVENYATAFLTQLNARLQILCRVWAVSERRDKDPSYISVVETTWPWVFYHIISHFILTPLAMQILFIIVIQLFWSNASVYTEGGDKD